MKRYLVLILLALLLLFLFWQLPGVHAQGPATPPPPPVTTPVPPLDPLEAARQIDAANARADQWQSTANAAVSNAQASINAAYGALANAQAGLNQAQAALQQERAARIAAQQGQIAQAVASAQAAQTAATNAIGSMSAATSAALESMQTSREALRDAMSLKSTLTTVTAQRDSARLSNAQLEKDRSALAGALAAERDRSDLYGKAALAALLMLIVTMVYIALVLAKLMRALHVKPTDRVVVLDERGRVQAQIEALH